MSMQRGADARVEIIGDSGSGFAAVNRFDVSSDSRPIDGSNTEGKPGNSSATTTRGTSACFPDLPIGRFEMTITSYDDADNPFDSSGLALDDGSYYELKIFPNGSGIFHHFKNALLVRASHQGSIPGGQPVQCSFQNDGDYSFAGQ